MKNNLYLLRLAIVVIYITVSSSFSEAQNDIDCARYANIAVFQNQENLKNGCGYEGDAWNSDYGYHFNYCMSQPDYKTKFFTTKLRSELLNGCGADPGCHESMDIEFKLNNILVMDVADGATPNAEPYVWIYYFALDRDMVEPKSCESIFYAPSGTFGNIGKRWGPGDNIPIPLNLGYWSTTLDGYLPNDTLDKAERWIFCLVVLLEHDDVPSSYMDKAHRQFVDVAKKLLFDLIQPIPSFWRLYALPQFERTIVDSLASMINSQKDLTAMRINFEEFIGASLLSFSWYDLEENPRKQFIETYSKETGSRGGTYQLFGEVNSKIEFVENKFDNLQHVALKTFNGQYVCADRGGGGGVVANRNEAKEWEQFELVPLENDYVALRTHNNHYLRVNFLHEEYRLDAKAPCIDIQCYFKIVHLGIGDRIALQAPNGQYLCAEGGGGKHLNVNRPDTREWETFIIEYK